MLVCVAYEEREAVLRSSGSSVMELAYQRRSAGNRLQEWLLCDYIFVVQTFSQGLLRVVGISLGDKVRGCNIG